MSSIGAQIGSATGPDGERADVELRLPADSAYASVLRTTTAGLAARLDFPIDDIEDLRIAVGEASAMVLPEARPGSDLTCRFYLRPGELTVRIGGGVGGRPRGEAARKGGGACWGLTTHPRAGPPGRPGPAPGGRGGAPPRGAPPHEDSFAWQVLTTLATDAATRTADGVFAISVTMESGIPEAGL